MFRGKEIGFIFQEPLVSLNPLHTIGKQIGECITTHAHIPNADLKDKVIALLKDVKLDDPERLFDIYGGNQRGLVALSTQLISNADKVTSADTQGTSSKTTIYANSSI